MRPIPQTILLFLLLALCGLCAWQWSRESILREVVTTQRNEIQTLTQLRDELEGRAKAADAEILRLTGTLAEMRAQSVSKDTLDEQQQAAMQLKEVVEKQNLAIKEQNDAIAKQNASIQQANDTIKKVIDERDQLSKKLNEVTTLYNKLAQSLPKDS